jgi:hypothetical protein
LDWALVGLRWDFGRGASAEESPPHLVSRESGEAVAVPIEPRRPTRQFRRAGGSAWVLLLIRSPPLPPGSLPFSTPGSRLVRHDPREVFSGTLAAFPSSSGAPVRFSLSPSLTLSSARKPRSRFLDRSAGRGGWVVPLLHFRAPLLPAAAPPACPATPPLAFVHLEVKLGFVASCWSPSFARIPRPYGSLTAFQLLRLTERKGWPQYFLLHSLMRASSRPFWLFQKLLLFPRLVTAHP